MLSEAEVFYASPLLFNDPLDCRPTIDIDVDVETLEKVLYKMLIHQSPIERAKRTIQEHCHMATEVGDPEVDKAARVEHSRRLASNILEVLQLEYAKYGVLSLARCWNCPLMWSHYADQHRGLCIEYSTADSDFEYLRPVDYTRPRAIKASTLAAWKLEKSESARQLIEDTFFFAKAPQWQYEREWCAVVKHAGPTSAPAQVTAVYFGLRCDPSVIKTLAPMHSEWNSKLRFYAIHARNSGFRLGRTRINPDEIRASGVKSPVFLDFREILDSNIEE